MAVRICVLWTSTGWRTTVDGAREAEHRCMIDAIDEAIRLVNQAAEAGDRAEIFVQSRIDDLAPVEVLERDAGARRALIRYRA